jgi:hypothetical protein
MQILLIKKLASKFWPLGGLIIGAIIGQSYGHVYIGGGIGAVVGFLILATFASIYATKKKN